MANQEYEFDEVIITSCTNNVSIYDSDGMKVLKNYKISHAVPKSLHLIEGEYFIAPSSKIPEITSWGVKDESSTYQKNPCGFVNALAVSNCGTFCVAALKTEIRVWNIRNGAMLASFVKHYQDVNCLRFSGDDKFFISGGKDGHVLVWELSKVLSVMAPMETLKPFYTWNNHTKEVTDIFVGFMGSYSRVVTASADTTCKIYELNTGLLLSTVCLEVPLSAVVMDPFEYYLIVGTQNGSILKINLYYEQPREIHSNSMDKEEVLAHQGPVNSLAISFVGTKILSVSNDGTFKVWETASLSCISTISNDVQNGNFGNAFFAPFSKFLTGKQPYSFTLPPLQRSYVPKNERDKLFAAVTPLKVRNHPLSFTKVESFDKIYSEAILTGYTVSETGLSSAEEEKKESLFQEAFRGETVHEVRDINAHMYTFMMEHVFKSMGTLGPAK